MVQVVSNEFWESGNNSAPADIIDIKKIENFSKIKLPYSYIDIMKLHDGGYVNNTTFKYYDYDNNECSGSIGIMYKVLNGYESILGDLIDPPEFFPKDLIPFADDGGGDLTCFDYRNCKENPPIVFWVCGEPEGEDTHFVANSFDEFLGMLHEPEPLPEEL